MSPFHLQVQPAPDPTRIDCLWLGASALRPEGSLTLPLGPDAAQAGLPGSFAIDLAPLLAELAAGLIPDAEALAEADDLLPLRDLLGEAGLAELCEALYPFLWRAARTAPLTVARSATDGRAWADPDRRLLRVWFATNRKLEPTGDPVHLFSDEASTEDLSFGRCSVLIPKSHRPGSTGTPWWRRWVRLEADDSLELRSTQPLPEPVFWGRLARCLAQEWQPGERNCFVLVHGFNVSFEEAAIRAAQLGYDLKVPGEIAFFSWPSRGRAADYPADEATIAASVGPLADFLDRLHTDGGAERIHLFVHSMEPLAKLCGRRRRQMGMLRIAGL